MGSAMKGHRTRFLHFIEVVTVVLDSLAQEGNLVLEFDVLFEDRRRF